MGLSAVCDCGISWSYSITILTLKPSSLVAAILNSAYCYIKYSIHCGAFRLKKRYKAFCRNDIVYKIFVQRFMSN